MNEEVTAFAKERLAGLKGRLKITHDDEDDMLQRMLASSLLSVARLVGASKLDESLLELSFERCLFLYNDALDEFLKLYEDEIENLYLTNSIIAREGSSDDEG